MPNAKNAARHPNRGMIAIATIGGVIAPPKRDPAWVTPWAKPRSVGRIQRESDRVAIGNAPASPKPKNTWITSIEAEFQASAVKAVNTLHQLTTIVKARRAPMVSPSQPPGIWKSA